jgi:nucleoid-associated protein YgaU
VNILNLKKTLKKLKLNESTISMVLGAIIIVVVGLLVINYFRKETGTTLPVTETQDQTDTTPVIGESHVVKTGESLWSIAEQAYGSGFNWTDIAEANDIENPEMIEIGQSLQIPDVTPKITTSTVTELSKTSSEINPIVGTSYTVEKGDSLWDIAVRAYGDGYKWVEIARENNLEDPNVIHTGNIFTLPR